MVCDEKSEYLTLLSVLFLCIQMSFGKGGNPYSLDKFFSGPDLLRADGGVVRQKIWQKYRITGRSLWIPGDARQVGGSDADRGGGPGFGAVG